MNHAARCFKDQEGQPEVAENAEGAAAAATIDVQLGFDFGFEDFEVFVDAAGGHATELTINQRQIGKNGQAKRQDGNAQYKKPAESHAKPNRLRSFFSVRTISPWSASWSKPRRCKTPCSIRIFSSAGRVRP